MIRICLISLIREVYFKIIACHFAYKIYHGWTKIISYIDKYIRKWALNIAGGNLNWCHFSGGHLAMCFKSLLKTCIGAAQWPSG